jgi:hypothetical protein
MFLHFVELAMSSDSTSEQDKNIKGSPAANSMIVKPIPLETHTTRFL